MKGSKEGGSEERREGGKTEERGKNEGLKGSKEGGREGRREREES